MANRGHGAILGFLLGAGIAAAYFAVLELPALAKSDLRRYSVGNSVEIVTIVMFCWGAGDLLVKAAGHVRQRAALRRDWLPTSVAPVPPGQADALHEHAERAAGWLRDTWMGHRLLAGLHQVRARQSAAGLDAHLKSLAETDADLSHGRYALVRIIAWMIPILGFLGTVVGITEAVANVAPDQLESSLNNVTGGLAMAFDATAVALALAMGLMFLYFLTERSEQGILHRIDARVAEELAHRFEATDATAAPYVEALRTIGDALAEQTTLLVRRQAEIWAEALAALLRQGREQGDRLLAAAADQHERQVEGLGMVAAALAAESARQVAAMEAATARFGEVEAGLARTAERLEAALAEEYRIAEMQAALADSMKVMQQSQGLDEAMHSLTGAVHLLTARYKLAPVQDRAA